MRNFTGYFFYFFFWTLTINSIEKKIPLRDLTWPASCQCEPCGLPGSSTPSCSPSGSLMVWWVCDSWAGQVGLIWDEISEMAIPASCPSTHPHAVMCHPTFPGGHTLHQTNIPCAECSGTSVILCHCHHSTQVRSSRMNHCGPALQVSRRLEPCRFLLTKSKEKF